MATGNNYLTTDKARRALWAGETDTGAIIGLAKEYDYSTVGATSAGGEQYEKLLLTKIYDNEVKLSTADHIFIGHYHPNSQGPMIGQIYMGSGKDATTNLPRYSTFFALNLGTASPVIFGTSNYVFYRYSVYTTGTIVATANGGTGVNSHTANRLVWSTSATTIQATNHHYASATQIGIATITMSQPKLIYNLANTQETKTLTLDVNGYSYFRNTIIIPPNIRAIEFRPDYASYNSYIYYGTAGNEALNFVNRQSVTSFMFWTGNSVNGSDRWYLNESGAARTDAPALQIKQNSVYINKLLSNGTNAAYNLYVKGNTAHEGNIYPSASNTYEIGNGSYYWSTISARWLFANRAGSGTDGGLSLYAADTGSYVIAFRQTSSWGKHGTVTSDWATYFKMNNDNARGWIFRRDTENVASISGEGAFTNHALHSRKVKLIAGAASETEGWKRCCEVYAHHNYGNFELRLTGGWNNGAPTIATLDIHLRNGAANIKVIHVGMTGRPSKIRLVKNETDSYWLDVYTGATNATVSDLYGDFLGNVYIRNITSGTAASGTAAAEVDISAISDVDIRNGTANRIAWYVTTNRIIAASNISTDGNYLRGIGGYVNGSYAFSAASAIINSWIRTTGSTGWYNESYGGGWYMTDANWLRNFNSKPLLMDIGTHNGWGIGGHRLAASFVGSSHVSILLRSAAVGYGWCVNTDGNWYYGRRTSNSDTSTSGDTYLYYGNTNGILPYATNTRTLGDGSHIWSHIFSQWLHANRANSGTDGGVSLYNAESTYAIMFRTTANQGKHGDVDNDWATYFTMSNTDGRGWIFKRWGSTIAASISTNGTITGWSIASSWIDGQKNNRRPAFHATDATDAGSFWPWFAARNTNRGRLLTFGNLSDNIYLMSSPVSRTSNGYDRSVIWSMADGHLWIEGGTYHQMIQLNTSNAECSIAYNGNSGNTNWVVGRHGSNFGWWNSSYWVMDLQPVGRLWVGRNANDGERQIGVQHSTSGTLYMWANASQKGLYSGTGFQTGAIIVDDGNGVRFRDQYTNNPTGLAYSQSGLAASAISWMTCWNGYQLRAISKAETANAVISAGMYWANVAVSRTSNAGTSPTFSTCYTSNWFRSTGATGWYSQTYGGGIWMQDSTYVRVYNSKHFWIDASLYVSQNNATGGGIYLADDGSIVDPNNGYCRMRFTYGVLITAGKNNDTDRIGLRYDGWIYFYNGGNGLYWPNCNGAHLYANSGQGSYGALVTQGARNGYNGLHLGNNGNYMTLMDNSNDKGLFQQGMRWIIWYNRGSDCICIGNSSYSGWRINLADNTYCYGAFYSGDVRGGRVRLVDNWVGFYQSANAGGSRYGYIQTNENRMYFRKENGVNGGLAFDFNGAIYTNGNGLHAQHGHIFNVGGNEFNWIPDGYNSTMWFNYETYNRQNNGTVSRYICGNGHHSYGDLIANKVYQAVWNDFAEYRESDITEGGRVLVSDGSGKLILATERLQPAARVVSDTFGSAVGYSDTANTPIGVGGRVLVYPYQNRNNYKVGDALCAAPNGTADIMTREEIMLYPDRIIGIVDEIPQYEVWQQVLTTDKEKNGKGKVITNIQVNGRIWIYVR